MNVLETIQIEALEQITEKKNEINRRILEKEKELKSEKNDQIPDEIMIAQEAVQKIEP